MYDAGVIIIVGNPILSLRNMPKSIKFCDRASAIVIIAVIY